MMFPKLLLFADAQIYEVPKRVYSGPQLAETMKDIVRGSYHEKSHHVGAFDHAISQKCGLLDPTCGMSFLPGQGPAPGAKELPPPYMDSCVDLWPDDCPQYARDGKCDMWRGGCEISCLRCRQVPDVTSHLTRASDMKSV